MTMSLCLYGIAGFSQETTLEQRVSILEQNFKYLEKQLNDNLIGKPLALAKSHGFCFDITKIEGNEDNGEVSIYMTIWNTGEDRKFYFSNATYTIGKDQNGSISQPGHYAGSDIRHMKLIPNTPCEYIIKLNRVKKAPLLTGLRLELNIEEKGKIFGIDDEITFKNIPIQWVDD